jgi:hypothetical protein
MDLIEDSVKKLEDAIRHTGCEDGAVTLRRDPTAVTCQFERGVCIEASYGGRTGEFVTQHPVEATTKIAFMFGTSLQSPQAKGAACALLNVLSSFLCLARGIRACPGAAHTACLAECRQLLSGKRIFILGEIPLLEREPGLMVVKDPGQADIILIGNEGLITEGVFDIVSSSRGCREILCIGPSTAGVAGLQQIRRFCPYGT